MVNVGHPSRGCRTCRIRRIRCDEAYPVCSKCVQARRICLGYRVQRTTQVSPDIQTQTSNLTYRGDVVIERSASHSIVSDVNNIYGLRMLQNQWGHDQVAILTMEVVAEALNSLQLHSQSMESRVAIHRKYGLALYQMRKSLSSQQDPYRLYIPALLFSLYEMIVNVDQKDQTWQIHLHGLLMSLQQSDHLTKTRDSLSLLMAIKVMRSQNIRESISAVLINGTMKAGVLLDIIKICLRRLNTDFISLFAGSSPPRKLDVQKIRKSTRELHDNLSLIPSILHDHQANRNTPLSVCTASALENGNNTIPTLPSFSFVQHLANSHPDVLTIMKWNEYRTLTILTSTLLLKCNTFLDSGDTRRSHRSSSELSCLIQQQADDICVSVMSIISINAGNSSSFFGICHHMGPLRAINMLTFLWPLYCASEVSGKDKTRREFIERVLWSMGQDGNIPIAMSMVLGDRGDTVINDTLSGLLLISHIVEMS